MDKVLGKKGFIFTLDVILGLTIVFIILAVTLFFVSRSSDSNLAKYQAFVVGSDIVRIMDREKVFDTLDQTMIETRMEELLPTNYEMLIRIEGAFSEGNGTIEIGGNIPQEEALLYGRRVAITEENLYLKMSYVLWLRE